MISLKRIIFSFILIFSLYKVGLTAERFPPPEFETEYVFPDTTQPAAREGIYEYLDASVLLVALVLSVYLVLKKRSRKWIFALMIFSLLYFGFWRLGCICSIGAIQNVVLSFFDPSYAIPVIALIFFLLPLLFTIFFGRTFCAAVCPLGAIQDVVALKPVTVPRWLENGLRLLAYLYLALAILFAATGSAFIICRYDPFVAFFRLSGNLNMLILGACILVIGVFIGRPYCRFLCPYGVILRQLSRISKWHATITPDECVQCRLCESSCPFGAIREPAENWPKEDYRKAKKRLALILIVLPVLIFLGGWAGASIKNITSRVNARVRLAERIRLEETMQVEGTTDASAAFLGTGEDVQQLYEDASNIKERFELGGWILGGFVGLIIGLKFINVSVWRKRNDYQTDKAACVGCGRCFEYCPVEKQRKKTQNEPLN